MKKVMPAILAIAMIFGSNNAFAQGKFGADSAECIKYLSYYQEYLKQKNYDDATSTWRKAYSLCPATASQNMLIDGTTLVRRLIAKNARNVIYKEALVDTLLQINDTRAQYYPKYAVTALNNKGLDLQNYVKDNDQKLYDNFKSIIEVNQAATKPQIFLFALKAAINLHQAGSLDAENVLDMYQTSIGYLETAKPKTEAEAGQIAKVKTDLESLFISSKVASCEDLIKLFTPRYEADPENLDLATNIVKMMSITDDCMDNDLYLKAATTMYKLDPSYKSAYFLYRLNSAKNNVDEAIKYLEEAIAAPKEEDVNADYTYQLAAYCFKNNKQVKAFELAKQVIELDNTKTFHGKAYFLCGQIWSSVRCGGNEITSRANYWVATDYFNKAKAADETLAEEAGKFIATCTKYYPNTADAFMYDYTNGQSFTASCNGMTASTTVRTSK